jgi:hypothetical protein
MHPPIARPTVFGVIRADGFTFAKGLNCEAIRRNAVGD